LGSEVEGERIGKYFDKLQSFYSFICEIVQLDLKFPKGEVILVAGVVEGVCEVAVDEYGERQLEVLGFKGIDHGEIYLWAL
jgi:hypothetical protein